MDFRYDRYDPFIWTTSPHHCSQLNFRTRSKPDPIAWFSGKAASVPPSPTSVTPLWKLSMLQLTANKFVQPAAVVVPTQPVTIDTKVLHVVNGEHFSGAERVQSHLGRCLPKFGIQADFACLKPGKFAAMVRDIDGQWGFAHDTPMSSRIDLRPVKLLRDLTREHDYHLFHAHTPRAAMITAVASAICGVPWIYHVHSPASRDSLSKITNQVNAWIEKQSLRGASHLITVSESLRLDCVVKGVSEDRVTVVHNGVPEIRPTRTTTPQPGGKWVIGMVALMRPRKGLEVLLDALAKLKEQGTEVVLRCIGPFESEQYRHLIENQIERLGIGNQVEVIGFTDDVPLALSQLDAMVLPSVCGEGLPMVVLEAMAAALPVIATRVEGTPEAITHGVEGLVAEPSDPDSLASEIAALVSGQHDWQAMAEAACDRHHRCFSDLAMSSGTADVYRNLLS